MVAYTAWGMPHNNYEPLTIPDRFGARASRLMKFLEPMISVIFWILLFASPLLFGNFEEGVNWEHIIRVWKSFVPFLFLFLLNRFVFLPYFFFSNRRWLYFISNGILILIMAGGAGDGVFV